MAQQHCCYAIDFGPYSKHDVISSILKGCTCYRAQVLQRESHEPIMSQSIEKHMVQVVGNQGEDYHSRVCSTNLLKKKKFTNTPRPVHKLDISTYSLSVFFHSRFSSPVASSSSITILFLLHHHLICCVLPLLQHLIPLLPFSSSPFSPDSSSPSSPVFFFLVSSFFSYTLSKLQPRSDCSLSSETQFYSILLH